MSIIKKTRPADADQIPAGLPIGFDDTKSDYFVYQPFRQNYAATVTPTPTEGDIRRYASIHATRRMDLGRQNPPEYDYEWEAVYSAEAPQRQALLERILLEESDELRAHYRHDSKIVMLEAAARSRLALDDMQAQLRTDNTCPTCGMFDLAANGVVEHRSLGVGGHERVVSLWACESCYDAAKLVVSQHNVAVVLADGSTREEAVLRALAAASAVLS